MKKDGLGKKLSEELSDYSSPADFERLWGQIEQKRGKKKDRRWLLLFLLFALFGGGGGATIYWMQQKEVNVNVHKSNPVAATEESIEQPTKEVEGEGEREIEVEVENRQKNRDENKNDIEAIIAVSENRVELQISPVAETKSSNVVSQEISNNNPTPISPKNKKQKQTPTLEIQEESYENYSSASQVQGIAPESPAIQNSTASPLLNSKSIWAKATSSPPDIDQQLLVPPLKKGKALWLNLSAAYGLQQVQRGSLNTGNKDYTKHLSESEETLHTMGIQLGLKKYLGKRIFLQTGLGYTMLVNRFQDEYNDTFSILLDSQVVKVSYSIDGTRVETWGRPEVSVNRNRLKTVYNRTHLLQVPLLAGIDFPFGKRWGVHVAGGLSYGYLFQQRGSNYADDSEKGQYIQLKESDFSSRHLLHALAQIQLSYNINSRFAATANLSSSLPLNSLENPILGVKEKWRWGAIGLGFQIRI